MSEVAAAPPRPAPADPTGVVTIDVAARFLDISAERIRQLIRSGHIERYAPNKVQLISAVRGYVRFLKDTLRENTKAGAGERVKDARAQQIEQQLAKEKRDLIPREDADAAMDVLTAIVRDEFRGLPARATRDMEQRRKLEAEVDGSFTRVAKALQELARFTRKGGDLPYAGGGDDAG